MIKIGAYNLCSVETGEFALDGGAMFGIIPKPLWSGKIGVDDRNRIDMRLRALLVEGAGRIILVDTGIGNKGDGRFNDIYRVDHSRYTLEKSLAEKNLKPEDITDVIISHLHFDHAGGGTKMEKGKYVPAFPNARYHIQKKHVDLALNPSERETASFRKEDIVPLLDAGVVNRLNGPAELTPGIFIEVSRGHSEFQQHLVVRDDKTTLFYCADMIPTSVHVGLPWIMGYDTAPLVTLEEKKKILKKAVDEKWILFFEHCPHMAAGRVGTDERGNYIIIEAMEKL